MWKSDTELLDEVEQMALKNPGIDYLSRMTARLLERSAKNQDIEFSKSCLAPVELFGYCANFIAGRKSNQTVH